MSSVVQSPPEEQEFALASAHPPRQRARHRRVLYPLELIVILAVQATLSLGLMTVNTAFQDEALYLWAGHLEWIHWLQGTRIPAFPTYFSGAPVLYPPLAALANSIGGLTAARFLSLLFMLGTTTLLWATAKRLFRRRAGFFAAALFAVAGPTLRLGAFATYDAMGLFFIALAAWCAVQSNTRRQALGWAVGVAVALALANATTYSTALFDPVVIALASAAARRTMHWPEAIRRGLYIALYYATILIILLAFAGSEYIQGILQTTIERVPGTDSIASVLGQSWHFTEITVILTAVAFLLGYVKKNAGGTRAVLAVALVAVLLVPVEQAHVLTLTSLGKHVDLGLFFGSIGAGFAIDAVIGGLRWRSLTNAATCVAVALLIIPLSIGHRQSEQLMHSWPNSSKLVAAARPLIAGDNGRVLAEHPSLFEYYLPEGVDWTRWSSTRDVRLSYNRSESAAVGRGIGASVYLNLIHKRFFSVIELDFGPTGPLDNLLVKALRKDRDYRLAIKLPYGRRGAELWVLRPGVRGVVDYPAPHGEPFLSGLLFPVVHRRTLLGPVESATVITGLLTALFVVIVRYGWRRKKGSADA